MKKFIKIGLPVIISLGLVLGVALPGLAASDQDRTDQKIQHPRLLRGIVSNVDDENQEFFTINDGDFKIRVDKDTRFFKATLPEKVGALFQQGITRRLGAQEEKQVSPERFRPFNMKRFGAAPSVTDVQPFRQTIPALPAIRNFTPQVLPDEFKSGQLKPWLGNRPWFGRPSGEASFDDIDEGDRVIAWVVPGNGKPLARLVLIIEPSELGRVAGTVIDVDESTITIKTDSATETADDEVTLKYNDSTIFILRGTPFLEEEMRAVAIYVRTGEDKLAKRVIAGMPLPE